MNTGSHPDENNGQTDPTLSPSLSTDGGGSPAFELKFLLKADLSREVQSWASKHLQPDPHGDPAAGGQYVITSLYTDTDERDIYHRSADYTRRKYRLRRYGEEPIIHLERKTRRGDRVSKQRTAVSGTELDLRFRDRAEDDWPGRWFQQRIHDRRLFPVCQIGYSRTAFLGTCAEGPLRLTLDRQIRGQLTTHWEVRIEADAATLLPEFVVLELKFRASMPTLFRKLVEEFQLCPTGVSKYRHCLESLDRELRSAGREMKYA